MTVGTSVDNSIGLYHTLREETLSEWDELESAWRQDRHERELGELLPTNCLANNSDVCDVRFWAIC